MKVQYTNERFNPPNIKKLQTINGIVEEYVSDGYVLTLRQLYYQLVSRDVIPNNQKEYSKLSVLLTKGRMAGIVDWSAIEDRGRVPRLPFHAEGVKNALEIVADSYKLDRQLGQKTYIEVWVEKEALSNIFARVTVPYHVRLMVNKGYSSCSAMRASAIRIKRAMEGDFDDAVILYFGDHDPSGLDMVRDIRDRMKDFGVTNLTVDHPALNMKQIEQYKPPVNPTKLTDPRANWYVEEFGYDCWELDAIPPRELHNIIEAGVKKYLDQDVYDEMLVKEEKGRKSLQRMAKRSKSKL